MRGLAPSEVQFETFVEADELGPDADYDGPEFDEGWWTVTVRAIWWSPNKCPHDAEASVSGCALTAEYTSDVVLREHELCGRALDRLNEKLRELFLETQAIREYLL